MKKVLDHWGPELAEKYADFYRDLHQNPELSLQEHRTAAKVSEALRPLGFEVLEGIGGTGVVGVLKNGDGPVVMLRADMDALPIEETTGLPYASSVRAVDHDGNDVPVMHACGHDMHVTCLLGASTLLAQAKDSWRGTLISLFQPAEELVCGARGMVEDGLFDRVPHPEVILGQHLAPMPTGFIGHGSGPMMAASDTLKVVLHGRGGHGSRPDDTVDPVLMAAAVVMRLQGVVSREVPVNDKAVVTVGRLHAGIKDNVIPDKAELGINIRTHAETTRHLVRTAVERIIRAEAMASGADKEPDFAWTQSTPVLVTDPDATTATVAAFARHFGPQSLKALPPVSASEDVGVLGDAIGVPTVYWFWGGADPQTFKRAHEQGATLPTAHSPNYAPAVEPTLSNGVETLAVAALTWLGSTT